jgi:CheY-like chemotaxis protein
MAYHPPCAFDTITRSASNAFLSYDTRCETVMGFLAGYLCPHATGYDRITIINACFKGHWNAMSLGTILVVDDEKGFLRILQILLTKAGYKALLTDNPLEGLALASKHQPDLIILDDEMPDLMGGDLCVALKQEPTTEQIPVLMYSGSARTQNPEFIKKIGANAAIKKPCMPVELLQAIKQHINTQVGV